MCTISFGSVGAAGLRCSVVADIQLKQAPFAHHSGLVGTGGFTGIVADCEV
jgi:hypothetical protein